LTFRSRFGQFVSPLPSKLNEWFVRWKNSKGQAVGSKEEEIIDEAHFPNDRQDCKEKESEARDSEEQDSEEQDSEGQDSEEQDSEEQDSEGQDSEGQDSEEQDSEGQDFEGQDSEGQDLEDGKSEGSNSEEGSVTADSQGSLSNPDPVPPLGPASRPASSTPNNAVPPTTSTAAPAPVPDPAETTVRDEKLDFKHLPENDVNALINNKETEWIEVKKQVKSKQRTAIPNQTQSAGKRKNTFTTKGTKVLHCCLNGMSCTVHDCDLVHGVFESKQESRFQREKKQGTSQQWSGLVACALALRGVRIISFFCSWFLCRLILFYFW
jgi:hypothetical protein